MSQKTYLENNSKTGPFLRVDGVQTIWLKAAPEKNQQLLDLSSLLAEIR